MYSQLRGRTRRHKILEFLRQGPATWAAIRRAVGLASRSVLDHHLDILERDGRVVARLRTPSRVTLWRQQTGQTTPRPQFVWEVVSHG